MLSSQYFAYLKLCQVPAPIVFNFAYVFQAATTRRGAPSACRKAVEGEMGFILRSVFWLGLASIIVPAEARLGASADKASGKDIPVAEQLHDAAYAAWGFAVEVGKTCQSNPSLCEAGQNLVTTVGDTGASLLQEAQTRFIAPKNAQNTHLADASAHAQQHKKFQDRIE
jgi:hypothetical protein